ncbi:cell envelope integrity protein CreD [Photobacterium sp. GJ3]|uniref:cell envelope integrity protein CreD n=1 Tax=Photobacterium sp. GJ3 TaxID=2829502 RepID=UPI001B8B5805|nr:cell envelope integrity protein CreD [Photobacterium sp. GJ3]QUJ66299.1 cell envelope integrity protein CreD [Photobacterium sp. GJ3]
MKKIFQSEIGMKFGFVLFLLLLLQIPTAMIQNLISERSDLQDSVRRDIARSSSDRQSILGPLLIAKYRQTVAGKEGPYEVTLAKYILPEQFQMNAQLKSFEKYRGIYTARLYHADTNLKGSYALTGLKDIPAEQIESVELVVAVSDSRGINHIGQAKLNGQDFRIQPGTGLKQWSQGFHIPLDPNALDLAQPLQFDLSMVLQGMDSLSVSPVGKQTEVALSSAWPHPSFTGDYLPVESNISEQGFNAVWMTNHLSSNIDELLNQCLSGNRCDSLNSRQMGVSLIEPVDHYLKSYRAINYSLLVITLVFAAFFLLEIFQAKPIHPVQYGFVGLALAVFYLLLISFSEHIGFNGSYLVSAFASSAVLGVYVAGILRHTRHGAVFAGCMLMLYALLFGLLQAESYALLMGTLLCFVILSFVMVLTRHINWYDRSAQIPSPQNNQPDHENQSK